MTGAPRLALSVYVLLTLATSSAAGQATTTVAAPSLTPAQMEDFLLKGRVVRTRDAGVGVTGSRRVTLSDGSLTHDAHVQVVDVERTRFEAGKASEFGFKDSYRFNIGGYRLAALLGVRVPISVRRSFEGKPASFTWWVDDVAMDEAARAKSQARADDPERTSKQLFVMRAFDELIQNQDRNRGNMLWTKDWTLWLIDHTRAFRLEKGLRKSDDLVRIDRALLARLRDLDVSRLRGVMDGVLTTGEIEAVMARRDALVRHFDARIQRVGETAVLFDQN